MIAELIKPHLIPGTDIDPGLVSNSATSYSKTATAISTHADAVVTSWSGLSEHYSAPEAPELLAAMSPVGADARTVADKLTQVSTLLDQLASDIATPVRRLKELQAEAEDFVAEVGRGVQEAVSGQRQLTMHTVGWDTVPALVERNDDLLRQVDAEVAKISAASATCVDGINRLREDACMISTPAVTAAQLDADKDLAWGAIGHEQRSCLQSVAMGIGEFVGGTVSGVAAIGGYDTSDGSEELGTSVAAISGIASGLGVLAITLAAPTTVLAAVAPSDSVPEPLRGAQSWYATNLEALAYGIVGTPEQWDDDPVAARTTAVVGLGSLFVGGAGIVPDSLRGASVLARTGGALEHASTLATDGSRLATGLSRAGTLTTKVAELLGANPRLARVMTDDETIQAYFRGLATDTADDGLARDATLSATIHDLAEAEKHADALPEHAPSHVDGHSHEPHETTHPHDGEIAEPATPTDGAPSTPRQITTHEHFPQHERSRLSAPEAPPEHTPSHPHAPTGDDYWKPLTHDEVKNLPVVRDGSHLVKGKLSPNTWYQTGEHEYLYRTNEHGHIDRVIAEDVHLKIHEGRLRHDPNTLGKIKDTDHASHLLADWLGGSPKLDNLVSMLKEHNTGRYLKLERRWAGALSTDPPGHVSLDIRIHTDPTTGRPTRVEVISVVNGSKRVSVFKQ
jgi:hypothetical protein